MGVPSIAGWLDKFILPGTLVSLDMLTEHHAKDETICSKGGPGIYGCNIWFERDQLFCYGQSRGTVNEGGLSMAWQGKCSTSLMINVSIPSLLRFWRQSCWMVRSSRTTNSQGGPWCAGWRWKSGRVRTLAIIVTSRLASFPNLSTIVVLIPYSMQMGEEMIHEWHHHL